MTTTCNYLDGGDLCRRPCIKDFCDEHAEELRMCAASPGAVRSAIAKTADERLREAFGEVPRWTPPWERDVGVRVIDETPRNDDAASDLLRRRMIGMTAAPALTDKLMRDAEELADRQSRPREDSPCLEHRRG